MRPRLIAAVAGLCCAVVAGAASAGADGEAGVVIDYGDGEVLSFCISFAGDSISGEDLLAAAEREVNEYNGLVCKIDDTGCEHSGSFGSCTCECRNPASGCVSWALFNREYGEDDWLFSPLGVRSLAAGDGDVQGWRWGEGTVAAANPPPLVAFETICGHPPASVATATATATATKAPAATATDPPTSPASPTASPVAGETLPASTATPVPFDPTAATATMTAVPEAPPGTADPSPPAVDTDNRDDGDGDGGVSAGLVGFAGLAGALVVAIVAAVVWRLRREQG